MRPDHVRLALVAALSIAVLSASGVASAATSELEIDEGVSGLAADGKRVAVTVRGGRARCDGIVVWRGGSRSSKRIDASTNCPGEDALREGVREVALAGDRVAWIEETTGNLQDLTLRVRRLSRGKSLELAFAENHNGAEGLPDGDYVGNLYADGGTLVYNTWSVCTLVPEGYEWDGPSCDERGGDQPTRRIERPLLWQFTTNRHLMAFGENSYALAAIEGDRVATYARRQVAVLSDDGATVDRIRLDPGRVEGIGLWGGLVIMLRAARVELYSVATGDFVKALPAPPGARLANVEHELAVLVGESFVTVLRVTDGASTTYRVRGARAVDADLEQPGLFHAWNERGRARVLFVPRADIESALDQATARAQSP